MPRICCGSDELKWPRVKEIIMRVFGKEYNTEIMICNYHPTKVSKTIPYQGQKFFGFYTRFIVLD